ncbi:DEKNAAC105467 [Brettanomyces naardenensis]|uniref:DEKNAAC105467 n=1 Tax=Brettanomyces naardenensis TaxID=13370 RepID=A0A448YTK2_BRENA|nr:DEKNAAC105467 [Brettanomyces naardenensis]
MKAILHPLTLLNISDQTYRSDDNVQGFLLGVSTATTCSISMAVEILPETQLTDLSAKLDLLEQIYGHLKVVGFYNVNEQGDILQGFVDNCRTWSRELIGLEKSIGEYQRLVYVTIEKKDFDWKVYELGTLEEVKEKEIGTSTMENITLNEISQASEPFEDDTSSKNLLNDTKKSIESSLSVLSDKLDTMIEFLEGVESGEIRVYEEGENYDKVKRISQIVNKLENMRRYRKDGNDEKLVNLALVNLALLMDNSKKIAGLSSVLNRS